MQWCYSAGHTTCVRPDTFWLSHDILSPHRSAYFWWKIHVQKKSLRQSLPLTERKGLSSRALAERCGSIRYVRETARQLKLISDLTGRVKFA